MLIPPVRYKARGTIATDLNGTRDTVEFLNIAQDDAMSWPRPTHRTYPSTVNAHMADAVVPFIRKSMSVNNTLLDIFERLLQNCDELAHHIWLELHRPLRDSHSPHSICGLFG